MKYAKYGMMVLMLALVIGAGAPPAAAQEAFKGTFNLSTEAYWGPNLLQPGQYSIWMSLDQTQFVRVIRLTGDGVRATILTGPGTPEDISKHSTLQLEQINGVNVVRHLDAGIIGKSYGFTVSKNVRMKVERASAPSQITVPIATGGAY
ncbi:MAG TPA: hypothetical protein VMT32_11140 [Bryobacteraceae bacterium]|nr:hypothetical protein [Bryobacteraceae bacterium]